MNQYGARTVGYYFPTSDGCGKELAAAKAEIALLRAKAQGRVVAHEDLLRVAEKWELRYYRLLAEQGNNADFAKVPHD